MSEHIGVVHATHDYEHWLGEGIALRKEDLDRKHERMAQSELRFLRATYYLWLERFQSELPELVSTPLVISVGDLHVENFGTWRSRGGELIWGVNDFDEVAWNPITIDLVRLATSIRVVIDERDRASQLADRVLNELLEAWRTAISERRGQLVFDRGEHEHLAKLIPERDEPMYWEQLHALPVTKDVPLAAKDLVALVAAERGWRPTWHVRVAGLGSLGHRRLVALGDRGAHDAADGAREVKELGSPTVAWPPLRQIGARGSDDAWRTLVADESRHPLGHTRHEGWQSRRMSPLAARIEIEQLRRTKDVDRVVAAMARAAAVVHQSDMSSADEVLKAEAQLDKHWLRDASHAMSRHVAKDYASWRKHHKKA